jgi:hypothetical protein
MAKTKKKSRKRTRLDPGEIAKVRTKTKTSKRGRPHKRDIPLDLETMLVNLLSVGVSQNNSCLAVGINQATLHRWKKEDDEFRKRIEAAKPKTIGNVAAKMFSLTDSKKESVKLKACQFWLQTQAPEFQKNTRLDIGLIDEDETLPDWTHM